MEGLDGAVLIVTILAVVLVASSIYKSEVKRREERTRGRGKKKQDN